MAIVQVDNVYIKGALIFKEINGGNPVTVPPDGVVEVMTGDGSCLILAAGSVLKGIRVLFEGDPPYSIIEELDEDDRAMMVLCVEDGGVAYIVNESLDVTEPTERIAVSDAQATVTDNRHVQIFFQRIPAQAGARRWRVNDWAGYPDNVTAKKFTWDVSTYSPGVSLEIPLPGLGTCTPISVSVVAQTAVVSSDPDTSAVAATIGTTAAPLALSSVPELLGPAGNRNATNQGPFGVMGALTDLSDLKMVLTASGSDPDCADVSGTLTVTLIYFP